MKNKFPHSYNCTAVLDSCFFHTLRSRATFFPLCIICMYEKIEESYKFEVLPVEYSANVIIAEDSNIVDIKAKSLYNDKEYKIPVEVTSTVKIKQKTDR